MNKDRIIRLIGLIVLSVSTFIYFFIGINQLGSFIIGLLTGLGLSCLTMGERVLKEWKSL